MLLDEKIEVMTTGTNIKYYQNLGYECSYRSIILVNQKDLPPKSNKTVSVKCDYCGKVFTAKRQDLNRGLSDKHACKKCQPIEAKESNILKYGAESYLSTQEGKDRYKKTCLEKYGVENTFQNKEIQEKQKQTVLYKYGVENVFQNEDVKSKIYTTMIDKYGFKNPQQVDSIKEKTELTCIEKYGFKHPSQNDDVKQKFKDTMMNKYGGWNCNLEKARQTCLTKYGNKYISQIPQFNKKMVESSRKSCIEKFGVYPASKSDEVKNKIRDAFFINNSNGENIPYSKNQKYLADLYNGIINYNIGYYFIDMYFENDNIYCEYDGSGHSLNVIMGSITKEEFDKKEMIRYKILKSNGLKMFKIIHKGKKLPSDDLLLKIKDIAYRYLKYDGHNWIKFDLDKRTIETKYQTMNYDEKILVL